MTDKPTKAEIREAHKHIDKNYVLTDKHCLVINAIAREAHEHRGILLDRLESAAETNRIAALAVGELEGKSKKVKSELTDIQGRYDQCSKNYEELAEYFKTSEGKLKSIEHHLDNYVDSAGTVSLHDALRAIIKE